MAYEQNSFPNLWGHLWDWDIQLSRRLGFGLALAVGLMAFLGVVGFDSMGNPAAAAVLGGRVAQVAAPLPLPVMVMGHLQPPASPTVALSTSTNTEGLGRQEPPVIQPSLGHGSLTGFTLTGGRLTKAHCLTNLSFRP
ncbi:MAG: hypothetical protein ACFCVD_06660 [Nodosilinea sp.]